MHLLCRRSPIVFFAHSSTFVRLPIVWTVLYCCCRSSREKDSNSPGASASPVSPSACPCNTSSCPLDLRECLQRVLELFLYVFAATTTARGCDLGLPPPPLTRGQRRLIRHANFVPQEAHCVFQFAESRAEVFWKGFNYLPQGHCVWPMRGSKNCANGKTYLLTGRT